MTTVTLITVSFITNIKIAIIIIIAIKTIIMIIITSVIIIIIIIIIIIHRKAPVSEDSLFQ